jgi:hypothetical protein
MNKICFLDQFPVEIIHNLFNYFSTLEILFKFSNVSNYINNTLQSYPAYKLDFRSIELSDFNYICHHIQPKQVISLILSDDDDTGGQSELFLSRFSIEQFTRLRALSFIKIDGTSLQTILSNVLSLKQLRSFSMGIETRFDISEATRYDDMAKLKSFLQDIFIELLPQLNKLDLDRMTDFTAIQLPNLCQLNLTRCTFDEFQIILSNATKLRSFDVRFNEDLLNFSFFLPFNQLIRLRLSIKSKLYRFI